MVIFMLRNFQVFPCIPDESHYSRCLREVSGIHHNNFTSTEVHLNKGIRRYILCDNIPFQGLSVHLVDSLRLGERFLSWEGFVDWWWGLIWGREMVKL